MFNRGKKDESTDVKPAGAPAETPLPLRPVLQTPSQRPETPPVASPVPSFRPDLGRRPPDPVPTRASTPSPATTPEPAPRRSTETKRLTVGRDIELNGKITSCDLLVVEGRVEATLSETRAVQISDTGVFKGACEIDEAEISGRFDGNLTVRGRLWIKATGKVAGEIRYGQLEIECGGELSGQISVVAQSASVDLKPRPAMADAAGESFAEQPGV
jgi:cytoskeletal protein CcmA (bactofilin family)